MKTFFTTLAMVLVLMVSGTVFSQTKTWTGATSTVWNTSTNWSPSGVPTTSDNVTIPSAPANQPLINGTTTPVCNNLTVNTGATLTISGSSSANAQLSVAGTATFNGALSIGGGGITKTGKLITGNIVWNSTSTLTPFFNSSIEVSGYWTFAPGSSINMGLCKVTFTGTGNSNIYNYGANCKFNSLMLAKTSAASTYIAAASSTTLNITGTLTIDANNTLNGAANITTILTGNLANSGQMLMNEGTLSFEKTSGTQSVQLNTGDLFNSININTGGTVEVSSSPNYLIQLKGSLTIQSGIFDPGSANISLWGNWTNNVGPEGFVEGTGVVAFNGGNYHQYCSNENFYRIELNKTLGGALRMNGTTVTCAQYYWVAGAVDVLGSGTFTANDLTNDAIAGSFYCNSGCTINLSNYGGNIDLRGNLYIYYGTFNVYGGINMSWWPYQGNASLTMTGGILNFADQGILIRTDPTYTFTNSITGGTIKTTGNFSNGRSDFAPTAGIVELYGSSDAALSISAGNLFNLTINKESAKMVTLDSNATANGQLTVQGGTLKVNNKTLTTGDYIYVQDAGTLWMDLNSQLKIAPSKSLSVYSGGLLKVLGTSGNEPVITRNGTTGYYYINVNSGGSIAARSASFYYVNPLRVYSGATIDPANPFDYCKFRYCSTGMLRVENTQDLLARNVEFLSPATGYNVSKTQNSGSLNFKDATGDYSGPAYESDPYSRIDWTVTQPGLWTGTVSTDWWTSANWDDGNVPNAVTDVTIPATATYMPIIGAGVASSKSVTINGTLTIGAADLNVALNIAINGTLAMNNAGAELSVQGDIDWNSGSTANITADAQIDAYGHWNFNAGANANLANGTVFFMGSVNKWIRSYSANCSFFNLRSEKTGGAQIGFSDYSTEDLKINGFLLAYVGSKFVSDSQYNIIVKGNINSQGTLQCNDGAVKLDGSSQIITPGVNDYFNTLVFSQTGTASISSSYTNIVNIKGDLHIDSGIFNAGNSIIKISGHWDNNIGTAAFVEGTSRVIFNGGDYHQYCYMDETFYTLEINKPLGGALRLCESNLGSTVVCNTYDWAAGALDAMNGSFTASILLDNGIAGDFYVGEGGTITLGSGSGNTDLKGNLTINGGTFNIISGIESQWPGNGNASITMDGGELNVYPYGIEIVDNAYYTFTTDITGGSIRTEGHFINSRSDFNPTAGTIELFGSENAGLSMNAGSLWNLAVHKSSDKTVTLNNSTTVNGDLTVNSGTLQVNNKVLTTSGNMAVNNGGVLWMDLNSQLKIAPNKILDVNNGGLLKVIGSEGNEAVVTRNGASLFWEINVNAGGTIAARRSSFYYMKTILVSETATIDPANPFDFCKFRYGSGYAMLAIENSQELTIHNAEFLLPCTGVNVSKSVNTGNIVMRDASGDFSGELYESDPYFRIQWSYTQPGLWTGTVSTDWWTSANWDDGNVPNAVTDVTIPATATYMPTIGAGVASSKSVTINGTLTLGATNLNVAQNATINGTLAMNNAGANLIVQGDIDWNSGSTANITADAQIDAYGHWNFNTGANANLANGTVFFMGSVGKWIRSYSANCSFFNLRSQKTGGAQIGFSDLSTEDLKINGYLLAYIGSKFVSDSPYDIIVKGNINSLGTLQCNDGAVKLDGVNQIITPGVNDYFNTLVFSQTGTVSISSSYTNTITVKGNLHIDSGIFNADSSIIKLGGDWDNNVGQAAFVEGTSRVIFNGGDYHQYCYMDETFYTLEINKPLGGALRLCESNLGSTVVCNTYDWTAGALDAMNGSFTASILSDNGIAGNFYLIDGGTITLGSYGSNPQLKGNITMSGGTFNIIAAIESQWPGNGNASITMSGGELNVYPYGIEIVDNAPYTFTANISGGSIRTQGHFINNRSDFSPGGATIEMYGNEDAGINMNSGIINNLVINKSGNKTVSLLSDVTVNGALTVEQGTLKATGKILKTGGNIAVNNGGVLWMDLNSQLKIASTRTLNVNDGGLFKAIGTAGNEPVITHSGSDYYYILVHNNGTIAANRASFYYASPVMVESGGIIDPANPFDYCKFRYSNAVMLNVLNAQDLIIHNAEFLTPATGINVRKTNDEGSLTFHNASGDFSGSAFEDDTYMHINWTATQPGLWTGIVSTNWHTAANWDGGIYPTDTDVVIPATAPYMPTIGTGGHINSITINGTLTVGGGILNISGNANINGTLAMNAADAVFLVQGDGDINWNSGSTANITANAKIYAHGNWNFNAGANANLSNGTVLFEGPVNTWIYNYSNNCSFYNLHCEKLSGAQVGFSDLSTEDLIINGDLLTLTGSKFVSDSPMDIFVKGNITSNGTFQCNDGVVWLDGAYQSITPGVNDYFNTIVFSQTGTVNIISTYTNTITLKGNLHIDSGIFNAGSSIIKLGGDWDNNVGSAAFAEGTSRVIFNGGDYHQYCYMDETFYTLEINKPLGGALRLCESNLGSTVVCNTYDWTAGALDAMNGSFTAYDLYDNGLYGGFYANPGGAINLHQDASQSVDLIGDVHITGGEFKVYGGNDQSYWGANGNAYLEMSGGILDFVDQAIHVNNGSPYQFTSIITGGLIRTQKGFMAQSAGFNPSAGTVELYGAQNAMVISSDGGEFYNLTISKPGLPINTILLSSSIKNNLVIDEGSTTVQFGNTISCGEIAIKNGGDFRVSSATIKMKDNALFNINEGGSLYLFGYEGALSNLTGINPTDHYTFQVNSGAWMSADHTIFENMGEQGIYIMAGATLDGENTFKNCEFRNGKAGPSPLLNINNDQELVIDGAVFPANTWGGLFNVNKNVDAGSLTFTGATGDFAGSAFENDPYTRIFWGEELAQQIISIPAGWSGISSYIIPDDAAVANIFAPVQDKLVIIQNFDGIYWPTATVNTLGNWDDHAAYQIKMETAQQLTFSGTIQDNLTANLDAGWNYLPVLNACDNDALELFSQIIGHLQIVKEVAGAGVYWPQFGVNTLGELAPGKAYFVLVDEDVELEFPVCAPASTTPSNSMRTPSNSPLRGRTGQRTGLCVGTTFPSRGRVGDGVSLCASTPITHTIAIPLQAIAGITEGSIITLHNQFGLCCGAAIFQNQNLALTAFGDDPTTPAIDGMTEGEALQFRVFNPETGKEFTLGIEFDGVMPQGGYFTDNGLSAVKSLGTTGVEEFAGKQLNISVYPNPSTGMFYVSTSDSPPAGGLSEFAWQVSNTHGSIIATGKNETDNFTIDFSTHPKGIYYLKITQGGLQTVEKLVVQ